MSIKITRTFRQYKLSISEYLYRKHEAVASCCISNFIELSLLKKWQLYISSTCKNMILFSYFQPFFAVLLIC